MCIVPYQVLGNGTHAVTTGQHFIQLGQRALSLPKRRIVLHCARASQPRRMVEAAESVRMVVVVKLWVDGLDLQVMINQMVVAARGKSTGVVLLVVISVLR